jgi:hypothetical protein
MKKLILSVTAVAGLSVSSFAQGVIYFDGSNNSSTSPAATSEGEVFLNGTLDTTRDVNAELIAGSSSSALTTTIVTLLLSDTVSPSSTAALGTIQPAAGDVTTFGQQTSGSLAGALYDLSGNGYAIPGAGVGATEYFQVLLWTGNYSSYAQAYNSGVAGVLTGESDVFSEILTSFSGTANDIEGSSAINLTQVSATVVPEPSTLALAGVCFASMLFLRRRK